MINKISDQQYFSIPQIAQKLGISRIAVYQKVKKGEIKAMKIGRNFAIMANEIENILNQVLTSDQKKTIDLGVKKTVKEYSEALRLLGNN